MSTAVLATPQKPWRPTFRQAIPELIGAITTVALTFAVVGYSPLQRKARICWGTLFCGRDYFGINYRN